EFAITPDGPRGPAGVAQGGVLLASARAAAPIVPMRSEVSSAWRLGSWDRFMVPKPFARVRVTYGDPWVATGTDDVAAAELTRRMGAALGRARLSGYGNAAASGQWRSRRSRGCSQALRPLAIRLTITACWLPTSSARPP